MLEAGDGNNSLPGRFEIGSVLIGYAHTQTAIDPTPLPDSDKRTYRTCGEGGLRMASLNTNSGTVTPQVGTWRQMSWTVSGGTDYSARSTIYMRIA